MWWLRSACSISPRFSIPKNLLILSIKPIEFEEKAPSEIHKSPSGTISTVLTCGGTYSGVEYYSKIKGEKMEIKQYSNGTFILSLNLPYELNINDEFKVLAGCNKNFSTCCEKFYNAKNFRGEPHLPGINILLKIK